MLSARPPLKIFHHILTFRLRCPDELCPRQSPAFSLAVSRQLNVACVRIGPSTFQPSSRIAPLEIGPAHNGQALWICHGPNAERDKFAFVDFQINPSTSPSTGAGRWVALIQLREVNFPRSHLPVLCTPSAHRGSASRLRCVSSTFDAIPTSIRYLVTRPRSARRHHCSSPIPLAGGDIDFELIMVPSGLVR
jgi:hypothetical protein